MSERIVYLPEGEGAVNSILSMIPGLINGNQMNPALLSALQNGNRNQDMWGGGGCWWIWILLIFGIFGGNGFGFGGGGFNNGLPAQLNNDAGRQLLMQAIQGNGQAISQLSQSLGCSVQQLQTAICGISNGIDRLSGQIGTTGMQTINAIESSACRIGQMISDCCCKTQQSIMQMGYENRLATCDQTNTLTNTMNQNTLSLRDGANANTQAIINKLDAMHTQSLYDKIDALREKYSTAVNQLDREHQTNAIQAFQAQTIAPVNAALTDLSQRLAAIECKQPPTVTVPYTPAMGSFIPVNYGVNINPYSTVGCGC